MSHQWKFIPAYCRTGFLKVGQVVPLGAMTDTLRAMSSKGIGVQWGHNFSLILDILELHMKGKRKKRTRVFFYGSKWVILLRGAVAFLKGSISIKSLRNPAVKRLVDEQAEYEEENVEKVNEELRSHHFSSNGFLSRISVLPMQVSRNVNRFNSFKLLSR